MRLVDSTVWIELFRAGTSVDLRDLWAREELVTCLPVIHEVLQGFPDESAHRRARRALLSFPIVEAPLQADVFLEAVDLYRLARRAGGTVRSSVDCLIAACAIRNDLEVYHLDRDYDALSRVSPLKVRRLAL